MGSAFLYDLGHPISTDILFSNYMKSVQYILRMPDFDEGVVTLNNNYWVHSIASLKLSIYSHTQQYKYSYVVRPGLRYNTCKRLKAVSCSDNHLENCRVCDTRRCNT